jgi:hypothetical protein
MARPDLNALMYHEASIDEGVEGMDIATLGMDLGKNSCSLVGLDADGRVVLRRRMRPASIPRFTEKLSPCVIAMEVCCGAHYLGRQLAAQGHSTKLMPPEYVRPYVMAQKNDDRDAEAIAEAATRPRMRFVELKSQEQLDIQSLHRVRSRLVGVRTALINHYGQSFSSEVRPCFKGDGHSSAPLMVFLLTLTPFQMAVSVSSSLTCGVSGRRLINALQCSIANLSSWRARSLRPDAYHLCRVLDLSPPLQ